MDIFRDSEEAKVQRRPGVSPTLALSVMLSVIYDHSPSLS